MFITILRKKLPKKVWGGVMDYVAKTGRIVVVELTLANTWYEVLTESQARAIRGFRIKSRITYDSNGSPTHVPRPFDIALSSSPDSGASAGSGFMSMSSSGSADTFGPCNGFFARSTVAGCIIEILIFD